MVIVDSTVWVHYLRTPNTAIGQELLRLLNANEVVMVGPVLAEVLQGARDESAFSRMQSWLEILPYLEPSKETWTRAGQMSIQLRGQGWLTPLMDLLIASIALEAGHEVYTLDEHFQRVPGLRLHEASGPNDQD